MCGIAGIFHICRDAEIPKDTLRRMVAIQNYRGPDGFGFYVDKRIGLGHARLSIIDLDGGWQPIHNEDKTVWITFNGEIFNYLELREDLLKKGHEFYTRSDTEVIVHLYEHYGIDCLKYLNGQFAFALWDRNIERLFLARDRVGIRPIYYSFIDGSIIFASEIKALFTDHRVKREIDPFALDQIFTFWTTIPPRTAFRDVNELPAGHYLVAEGKNWKVKEYWNLDFTPAGSIKTEPEYAEQLRELLIDATKLQLRADVPVGAYLSGGIDSSVITTLIKRFTDTPLRTFSVTFGDEAYDESAYQKDMVEHLDTDHSNIRCSYPDIGKIFPEIIWHTETPILRTAPAPMYLLSKLVRDSGYKVVLTGEGSDEILAGYDIFKEAKARRFIERYPGSQFRLLILKRLYPYFANSPARALKYAETFFKVDATSYPVQYYSHIPRWATTEKTKVFFSDRLKEDLSSHKNIDDLSLFLHSDFSQYDYLSQAQYIETKTLLPGYLLSSQGDRVAMAHSIEGRFPFLDHRVIEFCCKLPPHVRMSALKEKYILKESMKDLLPLSVIERTKQPYMAPDSKSFFYGEDLDYVEELLSDKYLRDTGYFNPQSVSFLIKKVRQNPVLGFKDNMAIVGIISTLLLHDMFVTNFESKSKEAVERVTEDEGYAAKV